MANEITVQASIRVLNGNLSLSTPTTSKQVDQTTARAGTFTVEAATTETTVDFGDIVPGYIQLANLDATNYCEWTLATGSYRTKLRANGPPTLIDLSGTQTLYLKANTAACKVQVTLVNT